MSRILALVMVLVLQSTFAYAGKLSLRLADGTNLSPMKIVATSLSMSANGSTQLIITAEVAPNLNKFASVNITGFTFVEVSSFIAAIGGSADVFAGNMKKGIPFAGRDIYDGSKGTVNLNLSRSVSN